jgi:hypothetical protein
MTDLSTSPTVTVTIGRQSRRYHACITSAPPQRDAPSTLTLYAAPFEEVAMFAANECALDDRWARTGARLVLVDAGELPRQRARWRDGGHGLVPADPVRVGPNVLQAWLWRRLQGLATDGSP